MTTYLVTGGAGFIGFNLVRRLLAAEADASVVVLDKLPAWLLASAVERVRGIVVRSKGR